NAAGAGRRRAGQLASLDRGGLHAAGAAADSRRSAHARRAAARGGAARPLGAGLEESKTKRILLVCTGNICRSPLAAALLERALVERGSERLAASSAGSGAGDGAPAAGGRHLVG